MSDETSTPLAPETRDAAIAALKEARGEPAEFEATPVQVGEVGEPEAEPVEAEKPAPEAEHEVKAPPEAELKMKIRARLASIEAKEREFAERIAQKEREIAERASHVERQQSSFQDSIRALQEMARNEPSKFLEQTGIDLNGLVKAKIHEGKPEAVAERAMRELMEFRKQLEAERAAEKQAVQEREQAAARHAQEQGFLDLAKPDSTPYLARLAKKNPSLALQNAYLVSGMMQRESGGKLPDLAELAKRVDAELRAIAEEESPTEAASPAAKSGITPKKSAAAVVVKSPDEMTPAEKRAEAMRILREMRKNGASA